jgi:hypothetical protein
MQDAAASEKSDPVAWFRVHTHKVKYHRCIKLNHLSVTMSTVRPDEWLTRDCIFSSRRPMACVTFRVRLEKLVAVRVSVKLGERPPPLTSAGASPADDERQRGSRRDDFVRARA